MLSGTLRFLRRTSSPASSLPARSATGSVSSVHHYLPFYFRVVIATYLKGCYQGREMMWSVKITDAKEATLAAKYHTDFVMFIDLLLLPV